MTTWHTYGTCSKQLHFEIENDMITSLSFEGGCPGNSLGLSSMVNGMNIDDVITKLRGIKCGTKDTSCPDQLALALISWKKQQEK